MMARMHHGPAATMLDLLAGAGDDLAGVLCVGLELIEAVRVPRLVQGNGDSFTQTRQRQFQI